MAYQLFIGLSVEGTTDARFLREIVEKTFTAVALRCKGDVAIEGVYEVSGRGTTFTEKMLDATRIAEDKGITALCIHTDADSATAENALSNKITPFRTALTTAQHTRIPAIAALIPVRMTEAWMLADISLLQQQIGASTLSANELGLSRSPEAYADPKNAIENVLRIAQANRSKRHRNALSIADLYAEMGQLLSINSLRALPSFRAFEAEVENVFRELNLL